MASFNQVIEMNAEQLKGLISEVLEANGRITKNIEVWDSDERVQIENPCVRINSVELPKTEKEGKSID